MSFFYPSQISNSTSFICLIDNRNPSADLKRSVMADEKSQEKSVEGQDALGIAEDSTIIEHKALDQGASTAEPLLFIAADDASQENCVNGEDTLRSAQESTNAEHKTLEKALGTTIGSGNHTPPDVQAALHRLLQLLESGQKELTSTLQYVWN